MNTTATNNAWEDGMLWKTLICLLLFCLLAYWPLTFHLFSLKNDAIIYFLPVRYAISEAIQNQQWPFWTPYLNLGYPLHADMQSGVWNPFVLIISFFGTYTLKTLQWETIFYVYISGVGMLFLLKHFKLHPFVCTLMAGSYMLCGFNSDSAQFLYWISGTAMLPFVFLFYYRTLVEASWKQAIYCGLFIYLFFVTAYPGQFILLVYFLLGFLIWHIFSTKKYKNNQLLFLNCRHLLLVSLVFVLLSLPAIYSYISFIQTASRGKGVSYKIAMTNSFHPLLLLSHITPLASWKAPFAQITDPLARNSFFGIIPFFLLVFSFFIRAKEQIQTFLKWSMVIFLLFSFGPVGVIRTICYYALPLMDTFRHPSIARVFALFCSCLLAAFTLQKLSSSETPFTKMKFAWYAFLLVVLVLLIAGITGHHAFTDMFTALKSGGLSFTKKIKLALDTLTFADLLLVNLAIQLPFLLALYFFLIKEIQLGKLLIAGLINCFVHTALYQPFSVVRTDTVAQVEKTIFANERKGFPAPDLNSSVTKNSPFSKDYILQFGPLGMYEKRIGHSYHYLTPGNLKTQTTFWEQKKIRDLIFSYPLLYRADTLIHSNDSALVLASNKKIILLDSVPKNISYSPFSRYQTSFLKYAPDNWNFNLQSDADGYYCLQQNDHPNWKLIIDGNPATIVKGNLTYISFYLQKGNHHVILQYENKLLKVFSWFTAFFLACILSFALIQTFVHLNSID